MIADPCSSETYEFNSRRYFESFIHILYLLFEGISAKCLGADSQSLMPTHKFIPTFILLTLLPHILRMRKWKVLSFLLKLLQKWCWLYINKSNKLKLRVYKYILFSMRNRVLRSWPHQPISLRFFKENKLIEILISFNLTLSIKNYIRLSNI